MIEFVDTNVLLYAYDAGAGVKQLRALELVGELAENSSGGISIQVLAEFFSTATRKYRMNSSDAETIVGYFREWAIHSTGYGDLIRAAGLQRRFQISWWDALIVNSATELGCETLWTEDLSNGQRYGAVRARNPFV